LRGDLQRVVHAVIGIPDPETHTWETAAREKSQIE
jgi:hypothetical protein